MLSNGIWRGGRPPHLMHNLSVGRSLAACLLILFVALATADTFACPDGCQTASSGAAADQCNASGKCVFCTGGIVSYGPQVVIAPVTVLPAHEEPGPQPPFRPALVLDHPPRLT
jgi:hypothetical protein